MRAGLGGAFQHAGTDALTRHFQQAEMRDAPDLDARAILPQAVAQLAFDRAVVALLIHVDEVDHDQARKIAQAELARDFLGGFKIGLERGVLDVVLAGRAARVHVDRDQRFGLVDDDVAAGAQRYRGREHRVELAFDAHPREQRLAVAILFHRADIARHQHLHEIARLVEAGFTGHENFVDFLVVEIAQRTLDERAFLVNEGRRLRLERGVADGFPHPDKVFKVALDFRLGAGGACGAQDDPHALRHVEVLHHVLETVAVLRRGDLAADAAAAGGVRHQDGVTAGKREVGRQRSALVAAFFLDDLHQHHLAALDDFLNLVLAARTESALRNFLEHIIAADRLDDFFLGVFAVVFVILVVRVVGVVLVLVIFSERERFVGMRGVGRVVFMRLIVVRVIVVRMVVHCAGIFADRRHGRRICIRRCMCLGVYALVVRVIVIAVIAVTMLIVRMRCMIVAVMTMVVMMRGFSVMRVVGCVIADLRRVGLRLCVGFSACVLDDFTLYTLATVAAAGIAMARTAAAGAILRLFLGFAVRTLVGLDKGLTVGNRDLVVVGMDFAEGQEAVPVTAILDEGGLQ
ncbi:hypothetical protein CSIRO_3172 [Bradyrhizobiaceae bacterium SG-6C]|nr:hypothetical protein CSIRO_3172 [Bradyrhizobiaceae bacterium SG-6C]